MPPGCPLTCLRSSPPPHPYYCCQDSKLCNILFARELSHRLAARGSPVTVNAFGPGLITRTGFFRCAEIFPVPSLAVEGVSAQPLGT